MRQRRPHTAAVVCGVALTVAGVLMGGCGSAGGATPANRTPHASSTPSAAPSLPLASTAYDAITKYVQEGRTYVQCMRKNGVKLPEPDANGTIDYSGLNMVDPDATLRAATRKCASLTPVPPNGNVGGGRPLQ